MVGVKVLGGDGIMIENPCKEMGDATPRPAVGGARSDPIQETVGRLREFLSRVNYQLVILSF